MGGVGALGTVGREAVQVLLRAALDDATACRGRLVLLTGEAGIGKTQMISELRAGAAEAGVTLLGGAAWEDAGTPALWPWIQVIRSAAAGRSAAELVGAWGERAVDALRLVPELHGAVRRAAAEGLDRFPLFDSVAGVIAAVAERGPVLVTLDDLHWADHGSLKLLQFVVQATHSSPVLIVGAWRDFEGSAPPELLQRAEIVPLGGLGERDVADLLRTSGVETTPEVAAQIAARTGGNPLFVKELGRLIATRGEAAVRAGAVPAGARAVITRRLARLSQTCHRLLVVAAVGGPIIDAAVLAEVDDLDRTAVDALLAEAEAVGLITATESGSRCFSHALVRETLEASASAGSKREIHAALAAALDERHAGSAAIAHHLLAALPLGDPLLAADAATRAGDAACSSYAYEQAAEHFDAALRALGADDDDRRAALLLRHGDAVLAAGDLDGARASFAAAADLARLRGRPDDFARAALGYAAGFSGFEVRIDDQAQIDLLDEALDRLPMDDSVLRAWAMARLSVAGSFFASVDERRTMAEAAVAMARRLGDAACLGHALAAHCDAIAGPSDVERRLAEAGEIVALARAAGNVELELLGLRLRVVAGMELGTMRGVREDVARFTRLAEATRQPLYTWFIALWRGYEAHLAGDIDTLERCAADVAATAALVGSHNGAALAGVQRTWVHMERGDLAAVVSTFEAMLNEVPELEVVAPRLIDLYPGQADTRRRRSLPHVPQLVDEAADDSELCSNLILLARTIIDFADEDDPTARNAAARAVYTHLLPHASRMAVDGIGAGAMGCVAGALGGLADLLDLSAEAVEHYERALAVNRAADAALALARTEREYAAMLRRRDGDADRASRLEHSAAAAYASMGIRTPPARADVARPAPAVFRREGDTWRLTFRDTTTTIRHTKGMTDLHTLLGRPGREIHVLDLVGAGPAVQRGAGPAIDDAARNAYRRRLAALDADIADAEARGAADERAHAERDALIAQLSAAYGLGGRARSAGDDAERARTAVAWRLRDAISRIDRAHADLGRHLRLAVRTGAFCSYAPEDLPAWEL